MRPVASRGRQVCQAYLKHPDDHCFVRVFYSQEYGSFRKLCRSETRQDRWLREIQMSPPQNDYTAPRSERIRTECYLEK